MTVDYLDANSADFAMDLALLDVIEKRYDNFDVIDDFHARIAAGEALPRLVDIAKALDAPLDKFLKQFLTEVEPRTGIVYEVHGFVFKRVAN
jgi:hypothetical protein